eukprot:CAMPEP_0114343064 /NCGR_PEP_ID=MMETSP0101-20121206/10305_1 /TAXON_ID=38822 ORGANISM="Pteridomonas danica, Strain PT" /NCGR_SAMPLE_ID=MMETSP0101 /ASSEMBLY_ACC=CAM_ASM_000211 /LENGTH=56 /DNA_ID=CAMNT_0001477557 /DNA_START=1342 /DNA_END=1509 /DNA_ORIENTATION=+
MEGHNQVRTGTSTNLAYAHKIAIDGTIDEFIVGDEDGYTPLYIACHKGDVEIVKLL